MGVGLAPVRETAKAGGYVSPFRVDVPFRGQRRRTVPGVLLPAASWTIDGIRFRSPPHAAVPTACAWHREQFPADVGDASALVALASPARAPERYRRVY